MQKQNCLPIPGDNHIKYADGGLAVVVAMVAMTEKWLVAVDAVAFVVVSNQLRISLFHFA